MELLCMNRLSPCKARIETQLRCYPLQLAYRVLQMLMWMRLVSIGQRGLKRKEQISHFKSTRILCVETKACICPKNVFKPKVPLVYFKS